jgi:demethylmenaquinone methyltransferase/2-methoxy-6-polyprenyl-1,4-benzoquinol methylase
MKAAPGTRPEGLEGDREISRWVRRMFDGVAPRYDLLNHVLSFQTDRYWRWRTVRRLRDVMAKPGVRAVDLCCGSGDLLIALQHRVPEATVFGSDFSHQMLRVLKPGGTAAILEFSTPPNRRFGAFYRFYSTRVLPRIGAMISGVPEAYTYLPESVRKFPAAPELAEEMRTAGFAGVEFTHMTFGIAALHIGRKS